MLSAPVPPEPPKAPGAAVTTAVHVDPVCVTATVLPATEMVPDLWPNEFGAAYTVIVPDPDPLEVPVSESQGALATAVHAQPEGNDMLVVRIPPWLSNVRASAVNTGSVHEPAA